jgi:carbamoyl-phosphate synthase large subunit
VKSLNVLITAASRRVALVRAFQSALRAAGTPGRVVVTDVNPLAPAVHAADSWYLVPMSTSPGYIETISEICEAERIGLIVPTIDDELELFGRSASTFADRRIKLAVSPESTSRICNDKFATCEYLRERGIRAAASYLPGDLPASPVFPLFIKPRFGRGGVGAFPLRTPRELEFFLGYIDTPVVQQYLDGPEFTIDVLCDFGHQLLSAVPRERVVIRSGVMDRGRTVRDASLLDLAASVARALPLTGAANIQCRAVAGEPIVFEINPRFSGGIPLTIAAGGDFARLLVELALGRPARPRIGEFRDNLWMTSYEASMFVEAERVATAECALTRAVGDVA